MDSASPAPRDGRSPAIDRPVFLLGTGRSGTTLTLSLLGCHPDLAWASQYTNRLPGRPELAILSRILDVNDVSRAIPWEAKLRPRPVEPNRLLRYVTDDLFWQHRPLSSADVDRRVRDRYRHMVWQHLRWQGKTRFLQKHTGFPRTTFLRAIFPDGMFIHVLRDGRAVAASMLNIGWWTGTMDSWWWGPMRPEYEEEYAASGYAPVVLAAIVWKTLVDLIEPAIGELPHAQSLTIRYDALLTDTARTLGQIVDFCQLRPSVVFEERVARIQIAGSDDRWQRLPREDRDLLEASLGDHLERLGFS